MLWEFFWRGKGVRRSPVLFHRRLSRSYGQLCLGGGNARLLDTTTGFALPAKVSCIHNRCALLGGLALWEQEGVC